MVSYISNTQLTPDVVDKKSCVIVPCLFGALGISLAFCDVHVARLPLMWTSVLAELSYVFSCCFFVLNPISSFWSSLDGVGLCFLCTVETYMDPSYFPPDNYAS